MSEAHEIGRAVLALEPHRRARILLAIRGVAHGEAAACAGVTGGQLSNWLAGRRALSEQSEAAILARLGVAAPLVAPRPRGAPPKLHCDGLTLLAGPVGRAVELRDLLPAQAKVKHRTKAGYRRGAHIDGVFVEWGALRDAAAPVRVSVWPNKATPAGWRLAAQALERAGDPVRVSRVDVAIDYAVARGAVELVGVRTRSGMILHGPRLGDLVVPFVERGGRAGAGHRSSRVGSAKQGHVRLYAHPADRSSGAPPKCTRLEAQHRPRQPLALADLGTLADPFEAVEVVTVTAHGLPYPTSLAVRDLVQFGSGYVRARMGNRRFRELVERLPRLEAVHGLPSPAALFAQRWPHVAAELAGRLRSPHARARDASGTADVKVPT